MKRGCMVAVGAALALLAAACSNRATHDVAALKNEISPDRVASHLFFLASDSLKGRNTPSPELDIAARYIADQFARAGLQPPGGSYFQRVPLNVVNLGDTNTLVLTRGAEVKTFSLKTDFAPFEMTANREEEGALVFAGYGITAPEYAYDDYADIDVRGKIVVVLRHEPGEEDAASVFKGKRETQHAQVSEKVKIAVEKGAAAVLVATDPLNHTLLTPRGFPWPSLSTIIPKDALPITLGTDEARKVPVIHIGPQVMAFLFGSVDSLRAVQAAIDSTMRPHSFALEGFRARLRTSTIIKQLPADNVVGLLEGSDPEGRKEVVVVGAHYDHVGEKRDQGDGGDQIYNGADDNASGTSALIAIAGAMGKSARPPRRSMLLIAFAGEEKGLFGSRQYVRAPLFPLEKTVGMLNLDMVGRNNEDSLYLVGADKSPEVAAIARQENAAVGFVLVNDTLDFGDSDHSSFSRRDVPSLFFTSGLHPEYHRVSDHAELINTRKLARVAQLAFLTAWRMANDTTSYRRVPVTPLPL